MMIKNNVICFGEVLWDNLTVGRRVGGAPLNVCYHLGKNGINSQIISQIGCDREGDDLLHAIRSLGVDTSLITKTNAYPTSQVVVNVRENGQVAYEILENVAWDHLTFHPAVATAIKEADVFVYGSLAARSPLSKETLLTYLPLSKYAVFDVNLRQPFFDKTLILDIMGYCRLLKINDEELGYLAGWLGVDHQNEETVLGKLLETYPKMEGIILTRGSDGAVYFARDQYISSLGLPVKVIDTIGCGDAFLAAFIANKLAGMPVERCLQQAIIVSAFVATQEGGCPAYPVGARSWDSIKNQLSLHKL